MAVYQVTCIIKPDRNSTVDRIEQLQGNGWWATPAVAAEDIDNGDTYFVEGNRGQVLLESVQGRAGKFVRTTPNGTRDDNLLNLPQCLNRFRQ